MSETTNKNETDEKEEVIFKPAINVDEELEVTPAIEAKQDVKKALETVDEAEKRPGYKFDTVGLPNGPTEKDVMVDTLTKLDKVKSDGSTASYYELPEGAKELQDLISFKNMNAQMGEIGRAWYRYGQVEHSEKIRDAKKIKYYIEAEIERLEKYGD